jgi:hypothetical protein
MLECPRTHAMAKMTIYWLLRKSGLIQNFQNECLASKEQRCFFQRMKTAMFGTAINDTGEIKSFEES